MLGFLGKILVRNFVCLNAKFGCGANPTPIYHVHNPDPSVLTRCEMSYHGGHSFKAQSLDIACSVFLNPLCSFDKPWAKSSAQFRP